MVNRVNLMLQRIQDEKRQKRGPGGTAQETLERVQDRLSSEFTKLQTTLTAIDADTSLSEGGKKERAAAAAQEVLEKIAILRTTRTENEGHIEQLRQLLFTVPRSTVDPVLTFLREQEYRNSFKDQSPGIIVSAYAQALKGGNHEQVRALTEGPLGSLIPTDLKTRADIEHAERAQPAVFQNFQQAGVLKEHLDSLDVHAKQVLEGLGAKV